MSKYQDVDDSQLLSSAQEGSGDAFGVIYERYSASVFRYLYSHTGNRLDAEDLTEDVFLRAWRSLPNYRDQGVPFLAYLFRIARHVLIDHYRRSGPEKQKVSTEDTNLPDEQPGPAEMASSSMEQAQIHLALGRLREDYRNVLALRFLSDLSPDETAKVMGRSAGAVRVLQHRALIALRDVMKDM